MRFRRSFVGIDVNANGLVLAALARERSSYQLSGARQESLDGVFDFSSKRPNILDSRRFTEALRRGMDLLESKEEQVALSLPDRVGRLYLTELEMPFKSHQEGVDIIKWKLKSSLPAEPGQVKLDFQIMGKREEGRHRCLASAIALPVLEQYEGLFGEAGLHPVVIDFHSLNLFNYYRSRTELSDEFLLLGLETGRMIVQYFSGGSLAYQRVREGSLERKKLFLELNRTLAEARNSCPAIMRCAVYVHLDSGLDDETGALLSAAFEREVKILDPQFRRLSRTETTVSPPTGAMAAAIAVAERLI